MNEDIEYYHSTKNPFSFRCRNVLQNKKCQFRALCEANRFRFCLISFLRHFSSSSIRSSSLVVQLEQCWESLLAKEGSLENFVWRRLAISKLTLYLALKCWDCVRGAFNSQNEISSIRSTYQGVDRHSTCRPVEILMCSHCEPQDNHIGNWNETFANVNWRKMGVLAWVVWGAK